MAKCVLLNLNINYLLTVETQINFRKQEILLVIF